MFTISKSRDIILNFLNYSIVYEGKQQCCEEWGWMFLDSNKRCIVCNPIDDCIIKKVSITETDFDLVKWFTLKQNVCCKDNEDDFEEECVEKECDKELDGMKIMYWGKINEPCSNTPVYDKCFNVFHYYEKPKCNCYSSLWVSVLHFGLFQKNDNIELNCSRITIETNKGPLYFIAYNIQNGYYSHNLSISKDEEPVQNIAL